MLCIYFRSNLRFESSVNSEYSKTVYGQTDTTGTFESSVNSEYSKTLNFYKSPFLQFESSVNSEYSKTTQERIHIEQVV